jgi:osmotically-inducible protein OsmY
VEADSKRKYVTCAHTFVSFIPIHTKESTMANRYSNRSDRDRDRDRDRNRNRGENFGGSRREQNFNEHGSGREGQQFGSGSSGQSSSWNQGSGQNRYQGGNQGGNQGRNWGRGDFDRSDVGTRYGGGSQRDFGRNQWGSGSDRERQFQGRADVGRDFMTNQPHFERYGQMDDSDRQSDFGRRSSSDYGRGFSYSEPNRDFNERVGYSGSTYGSYGSRGYGMDFENRDDYDYDSSRTNFDESIAGRPYYGSSSGRGYYREGWRGYGSRPGNLGFGDRERPDQWNRDAYGAGGFNSGQRNAFNTDYSSTEYTGYYPRKRDDSWSFDRDRDRSYRSDYDRNRYGQNEESFGDKVKNFFGIGPKGYKRSDDRIREDISERLEDHPNIDASNIEVSVDQGVVTLSGTVDDRRGKRLAEDVTEDIRGVKDVHNQIRVQQSGASSFGDTGRTGTSFTSPTTTSGTGSSSTTSSGQTGTTTGTTKKGSERAA